MNFVEKAIADEYIKTGFPECMAERMAVRTLNKYIRQSLIAKYRYMKPIVIIDSQILLISNEHGLIDY